MLWLAAAFGLAVWEARRKRTLKARTEPANSSHRHTLSRLGALSFDPKAGQSSNQPSVAGLTLAQLKQELCILSPENISADPEVVADALRKGERALPELCNLLQGSTDVETFVDVTELLALLSPSRRGLQSAICDAGAVPPLLVLLASAADLLPQPLTTDHVPRAEPTQSGEAPRGPSGRAVTTLDDLQRSIRRRSDSCGSDSREAGSRDCSSGGCGGGGDSDDSDSGAAAYPVMLSYALRTLVNLTSNARAGAAVRQAILRDDAALEALLGLLHVPEQEAYDEDGTAAHIDSCSSSMSEETAGNGSGAVPAGRRYDAVPGVEGGQGEAPACSGGSAGFREVSVSQATRWHIAGLAAWLVAHLCSQPAGQIQLVQEGIITKLIQLVRHGRMAWMEAAAERAVLRNQRRVSEAAGGATGALTAVPCTNTAGHTGGCCVAAAAPQREGAPSSSGGSGGGSTGGGGRLMPHATSTMLYDAAAAAAAASSSDSSANVSAMPYMIAAVQYGMMALVNITFDNSVNQRTVVVAGMLAELETLFGMLLQPGVLLPRPASAGAATVWPAAKTARSTEVEALGGGATCVGVGEVDLSIEAEAVLHPEPVDGSVDDPEVEVEVLLRRGFLGVAQFSVWLLAHLSSSDPNLKADIAGSSFSSVTRLLDFLMLPDVDAPRLPLSSAAGNDINDSNDQGEERPAASAHPLRTASGGDEGNRSAAAGPSVIVVRQYAAMALVNLTCGVPSTKAAVARAMDWDDMAALLWWLADETTKWLVATAATAAAADGDALLRQPPPPPSSPVSDLLLYTVWLLQHLSLSPFAAAATDPRVIPPLVVLLDAPDAHVRLRASAAIGALCSSPTPAATATATATAAAPGAFPAAAPGQLSSPSSQQQQHHQQQHPQQPPQHPHRAAFLAADGVQRLLAMARRERDPHLLAYAMMCLSSGVGDGNLVAVAEVVAGGALGMLQELLSSEFSGCLLPAAEVLQTLARAAVMGLRRYHTGTRRTFSAMMTAEESGEGGAAAAQSAAAAAVEAAADYVPRSLLSRVVAVMLTHADPRVRSGMNEALGALTALPGVRERYCTVFAETLRDLVSSAEVELQVIPVN